MQNVSIECRPVTEQLLLSIRAHKTLDIFIRSVLQASEVKSRWRQMTSQFKLSKLSSIIKLVLFRSARVTTRNDLLFFVVPGSAVKCQKCHYTSLKPKAEQNCDSAPLVNCSSGYCATTSLSFKNGTVAIERDCARTSVCPDIANECDYWLKRPNRKSCLAECCDTDNCNNYTPSSAPGVMITKFTLFERHMQLYHKNVVL